MSNQKECRIFDLNLSETEIPYLMKEVNNTIVKWVHSLEKKKVRQEEKCFVVEGKKCVTDTIRNFNVRHLFVTPNYEGDLLRDAVEVTNVQMERMSMLKTPTDVLAVYEVPNWKFSIEELRGNLTLALDNIQDPGNLGTIIRIADWFGVKNIICGNGTVDAYNPKVVQATMGAISRVRLHYMSLPAFFERAKGIPVYGTFLDGVDLYDVDVAEEGIVVMGNEGNGISPDMEKYMTKRLLIPPYPKNFKTSESLNVGMATAIILSEFRRRMK